MGDRVMVFVRSVFNQLQRQLDDASKGSRIFMSSRSDRFNVGNFYTFTIVQISHFMYLNIITFTLFLIRHQIPRPPRFPLILVQ